MSKFPALVSPRSKFGGFVVLFFTYFYFFSDIKEYHNYVKIPPSLSKLSSKNITAAFKSSYPLKTDS